MVYPEPCAEFKRSTIPYPSSSTRVLIVANVKNNLYEDASLWLKIHGSCIRHLFSSKTITCGHTPNSVVLERWVPLGTGTRTKGCSNKPGLGHLSFWGTLKNGWLTVGFSLNQPSKRRLPENGPSKLSDRFGIWPRESVCISETESC